MTTAFEAQWDEMVASGVPDTAKNREIARSAWDAAVCAAQERMFHPGPEMEPRKFHQAAAEISGLHTWVCGARANDPVTA